MTSKQKTFFDIVCVCLLSVLLIGLLVSVIQLQLKYLENNNNHKTVKSSNNNPDLQATTVTTQIVNLFDFEREKLIQNSGHNKLYCDLGSVLLPTAQGGRRIVGINSIQPEFKDVGFRIPSQDAISIVQETLQFVYLDDFGKLFRWQNGHVQDLGEGFHYLAKSTGTVQQWFAINYEKGVLESSNTDVQTKLLDVYEVVGTAHFNGTFLLRRVRIKPDSGVTAVLERNFQTCPTTVSESSVVSCIAIDAKYSVILDIVGTLCVTSLVSLESVTYNCPELAKTVLACSCETAAPGTFIFITDENRCLLMDVVKFEIILNVQWPPELSRVDDRLTVTWNSKELVVVADSVGAVWYISTNLSTDHFTVHTVTSSPNRNCIHNLETNEKLHVFETSCSDVTSTTKHRLYLSKTSVFS
jgi:hypothetical protein